MELSGWDLWALASKLTAYVGCFLAIGSTLYVLATPSLDEVLKQRLRQIVLVMVLFGALGSAAQFAVQSGRLLDEGLSGIFDPEMLTLVKDAPLGMSVFLRLLGLMLLAAYAFQIPVSYLFGGLGALLTALSFSFVGHGTDDPRIVLSTLVTLHVLGISFWFGALWPLRHITFNVRELDVVGKLAHRFGQQATWVVGGLVIAGLTLAILIAGSPSALFNTQYGLTLIIKLIIVSTLLALAAFNKLRFVPAIQAGEALAANQLRRSITIEMLFIAVILIITAILTTITPLPESMDMTNG